MFKAVKDAETDENLQSDSVHAHFAEEDSSAEVEREQWREEKFKTELSLELTDDAMRKKTSLSTSACHTQNKEIALSMLITYLITKDVNYVF